MAANALTIRKADDKTYQVTITDSDGVVVNISTYTVKFTVRKNPADSAAVISKTTPAASGINLSDPTNGVFKISLSDTDTNITPGKYIYDVEMANSGVTQTVLYDNLTIYPDVSR